MDTQISKLNGLKIERLPIEGYTDLQWCLVSSEGEIVMHSATFEKLNQARAEVERSFVDGLIHSRESQSHQYWRPEDLRKVVAAEVIR